MISLACFTCQIFVTWKTGPDWWKKNGLRVLKYMAITAHFVMPAVIILILLIDLFKGERSIYLCWKVVYSGYCVGYMIVFTSDVNGAAYLKLKEGIENKSDSEVSEFL